MLQIASPPRFRLGRPPLVQALAQAHFPQLARLETLAGVAPIQDQLMDTFPYMQQQRVQELSLVMGPGGPLAPDASQSVVTVFSDDVGWTLTLAAGAVTLSVTGDAYEGVEGFADRLSEVLRALTKGAGMRRCDRLGVRYLDLVEMPAGDEAAWTRWFRPELVGWASGSLLADDSQLLASVTETRLNRNMSGSLAWAPAGVQAVVRHGLVPSGSLVPASPPRQVAQPSFLLDLDVFVAAPQQWDADTIVRQYRAMHAEIEKLFHWSITDEGRKEFGYEELS